MAITNYTELQAAVKARLQRVDLDTLIPDFIALTEAKLNRFLRDMQMETKNAAFSITGEYVAMPTDCQEVRSIQINTTPRHSLTFMPDDLQSDAYGSTGIPKFFNVVGTNLRFAPVPATTYAATIVYYLKIPPLISNATNWLLTAHPDAYLYGAMVEACLHTQDDQGVQRWKAEMIPVMGNIKSASNKLRWGGNGMTVRVA